MGTRSTEPGLRPFAKPAERAERDLAHNRRVHRWVGWLSRHGRGYRRRLARASVRVRRVPIEGLAPALAGLRIAFATDFHLGAYVTPDALRPVLARAQATRPDLWCLGGDYINERGDEVAGLADLLSGLHAPLGCFAVLGNHDAYGGGALTVRPALEAGGFTVLENAARTLAGGAIHVGGVGDGECGAIDGPSARVAAPGFHLLLAHHPDAVHHLRGARFNLVLSGHTHGGQIVLPWFGPPKTHTLGRYANGLRHWDGMAQFVGRGLGATYLPVRWRCPPEVDVLELVPWTPHG